MGLWTLLGLFVLLSGLPILTQAREKDPLQSQAQIQAQPKTQTQTQTQTSTEQSTQEVQNKQQDQQVQKASTDQEALYTPTTAPARAISLAPHITEILFAAGAQDHLIAVDSSSDYPPAAKDLPRVGDALRVNPERLLELKPDQVWAWQSNQIGPEIQRQLEQTHISLIFAAPQKLDDIPAFIRLAGDSLDTADVAVPIAALLDNQIAALRQNSRLGETVSVFLEIGSEPLYTLARDPLIQDVLTTCKAQNIYAHHAAVAPTISLEDVLHKRPQVVIMAYRDPAQLRTRHLFWEKHLGLSPHALLNLNPDALYRPGPRLIEATRELCEQLDRYRAQVS
ncbi:ABC transporter substrate-binding protein [Alcaligenes parafaecalis]|uniref:ABC transporter substrate-binding protein n=1 Tax=Alcaligenes parafaecalis TaxID=171260 RepID=A0ABT3VLP9_9BURK|nr:ABC transporter substrate-binding protein [Alcaligenes parafaecalis]MCX5464310.1 ABC transporter substrate-binding protein [Alcaligenes parafaecalis]